VTHCYILSRDAGTVLDNTRSRLGDLAPLMKRPSSTLSEYSSSSSKWSPLAWPIRLGLGTLSYQSDVFWPITSHSLSGPEFFQTPTFHPWVLYRQTDICLFSFWPSGSLVMNHYRFFLSPSLTLRYPTVSYCMNRVPGNGKRFSLLFGHVPF
jgi:hypothetical protein